MNPHALTPDRILGRSGLRVSPIGLGGGYLGWDGQALSEDVGVATVLKALELGVNLIDTSPVYGGGHSERFIGIAIREWLRNGGRREDLVISTKTGTRRSMYRDYSAGATRRSVEESLKLLELDTLDVLLIHDPDVIEPVLAPGAAFDTLKAMKAEGLVRAIGLGVRNHAFHQRLIETGDLDVSLTYGDYTLLSRSAAADILPLAEARGVGVFNGMTMEVGLLTGQDPQAVAARNGKHPYDPATVARASALHAWAAELGISVLTLNLQFSVRRPWVSASLVGAARPEEIEADVRAYLQPVPEAVWDAIDQVPGFAMTAAG